MNRMSQEKSQNTEDFEITFYEGIVKQRPDYIEALMPLAAAYTQKGLYQKGLETDQRLAKLCKEDPVVHYNLACSYALLGKKKEALKILRRAVELGYCDFIHLRKDPDLKSLHGDPDFDSIASLG